MPLGKNDRIRKSPILKLIQAGTINKLIPIDETMIFKH